MTMTDLPRTREWEQWWNKLHLSKSDNAAAITAAYPAKDMRDELLARIAELEDERDNVPNVVALMKRAVAAEADARGWADSFEQAEAALRAKDALIDAMNGAHHLTEAAHTEARALLKDAGAALAQRDRMLRQAAADYWREQMDGLPDDAPVNHIVEATIEMWRARAEEGSGK